MVGVLSSKAQHKCSSNADYMLQKGGWAHGWQHAFTKGAPALPGD